MNNNSPLFSIITVCYNAEKDLEKTINSVLMQDFQGIEYIIVDGGSTDGSLDLIKDHNENIHHWVSEPDNGIYDAMNKGLRMATGKYVNFLNAGDFFVDCNSLKNLASQLNSDLPKIISGYFFIQNSKSNKHLLIKTKELKLKHFKKDFFACHQSLFIHTSVVKRYDTSYKIKADYKWLLESLLQVSCDEVLLYRKPIVYYSQEGVSYNNFWPGMNDLIGIHREFFGLIQVVLNLDIYIYRFLRMMKNKLKALSGER